MASYNNPFSNPPGDHPPTYFSRTHTASDTDDNAAAYGGVSRPSEDYHRASRPLSSRESIIFQGSNSAMPPRRHDSYISNAAFSELAPDDSISVVGDHSQSATAATAVHAYGGRAPETGNDGDWRYEDPYAKSSQAGDPTMHQQEELGHHVDDEKMGDFDRYAAKRASGMLHPHSDDVEDYYHSRHGSTSAMPLVRHSRQDSDSTTIVGSYKDGKQNSNQHPVNGSAAYAPVLDSDATSPISLRDEEEGQDKYPPAVRSHSMAPRPPVWKRIFYDTTPTNDKIELHQRGIGVQQRAWVCYILALAMILGLVVELIRNLQEQGKPISTQPTFNYMIGPSSQILINTGARFTPCMKQVESVEALQFSCLNVTSSSDTCTTSLEDICGFSNYPHQTFRFVLPIFLHAGIVHLVLNLFVQLTSSAIIERQMGSLRFLILFIPSGVFGFILGGNFALVGQPSVGASGAIFGTHAAVLVDLIAHWGIEYRPGRKLAFLVIEIIVGMAFGLIPGIDNFAHIGGFAMGLLISFAIFPMIHRTRSHRATFILLRIVAAAGAVIMFFVLYRNFFTADPGQSCEWCRYLSCWPTASNNHCKGTGLSVTTTNV